MFFPSHRLLSHITIVETTDSSERRMNPVAMTITKLGKNIGWAGDRTSNTPVLKSATELWGSADEGQTVQNIQSDLWSTLLVFWEVLGKRAGFFFRVRGRRPSKGEKCTTKAIFRENFLWMLFYIILYNLCDPHLYTLLYYQLYRYLVSLYQIIWTFTDPENGGFWKTYLDKEKMLVTSGFYNVFYSTLTKLNFCHLQMLSILTYQIFCHLVWRYEAFKYTRAFFHG